MMLFRDGALIDSGDRIDCTLRVEGGQSTALTLIATGSGEASFDIDICGEGASVELRGAYLCGGDDRQKVSVNLRHSTPGSHSDQIFRGIAAGRARAVFDGRIVVAPDAQKTEAYQTNQNLLLSDDAVVESRPQLEIYADDVKCSHGATVGSLNADEQFYMRSRGISESEARRLQMISFLAPALEGVGEDVRETVMNCLTELL